MANNKITMENFSQYNRDKKVGNSLYRICRTEDNNRKWYIHETYDNGMEWACNNAYYTESLEEVINKINSFTEEKEIVSLRFGK